MELNIDLFCQAWIMLFGCMAVWLVSRREHYKRWGYIFGVLAQPAWLYTTLVHEQWGILVLAFWYTYAWGQGIYNYWVIPAKRGVI